MYNALQIANYFLKLGQAEGIEITPMKLIKLTYIAHGWHLGFYEGQPLLNEQVYAWKYGPVIPSLYERFKQYGSAPVTELAGEFSSNAEWCYPLPGNPEKEKFLDAVWKGYKDYNGVQLSAMTHQKGTPWYRVWNSEQQGKDNRDIPIPNNYIEAHYSEKIHSVQEA